VGFAGEACKWHAPAAFRRLLSDGEATTGNSSMRGARELDWLLRLLPDVSGRGGWRRGGRKCTSVIVVVLDLLQVWENRGHEEERHVVGK
jgi:hypothetical protein